MPTKYHMIKKGEQGAAMMIAIFFFIGASVLVVAGIAGPSARVYRMASDTFASRESFYLSESAGEDAYYRIRESLPIGSSTSLTIGDYTATTNITDSDEGEKQIDATSNVRNSHRSVMLQVGDGTEDTAVHAWQES